MITCTFDHSTTNQFLPPRSFSIIAPTYYSFFLSSSSSSRPNSFQPTPEMQLFDARDASFSKRFAQTSLCLNIDCVIMRLTTSFQVSRLSNYPRSYVRSGGERRKLLLTRFRYLSFRLEKRKKKNKNLFRSNSLWRVFFFFSFSNYLRLKTDRWNLKNFLSLESFTVKITLRVVVRELSRWISPHDTAEISRLMEKDWELFFGYFSLYRINFIHRFRAYLLLDNSILNVNAF